MPKISTFINEQDIPGLIQACGKEIRSFLELLGNTDENYFLPQVDNKKASQLKVEPPIFESVRQYKDNPEAFSDSELVIKGQHYQRALDNPVRIEVRRIADVSGAAQIAVRGISGTLRQKALEKIQSQPEFHRDQFYFRISGKASFEINIKGVDKSLPIKYLRNNWTSILKRIHYMAGDHIDAHKTCTVIAADGDGTTFAGPSLSKAPTLKTSIAYQSLLEYLALGGIYLIISGNHLMRTVSRIKDFIPAEYISRLLIVANGGANMVCFDNNSQAYELDDYRKNSLNQVPKDGNKELDIIYIGDDGRLTGNDREAFDEVGADRSILVAKDKSDDIIPSLEKHNIGGLENGTKKVLDYTNEWVKKHPKEPIFTADNIGRIVEFASNTQ